MYCLVCFIWSSKLKYFNYIVYLLNYGLWPGEVVPVKILSISQIDLLKNHTYSIELWWGESQEKNRQKIQT